MEFKYTVRLEILVIIFIVWAVLFGHLFCSCSKVGVKEAFQAVKNLTNKKKEKGRIRWSEFKQWTIIPL